MRSFYEPRDWCRRSIFFFCRCTNNTPTSNINGKGDPYPGNLLNLDNTDHLNVSKGELLNQGSDKNPPKAIVQALEVSQIVVEFRFQL